MVNQTLIMVDGDSQQYGQTHWSQHLKQKPQKRIRSQQIYREYWQEALTR